MLVTAPASGICATSVLTCAAEPSFIDACARGLSFVGRDSQLNDRCLTTNELDLIFTKVVPKAGLQENQSENSSMSRPQSGPLHGNVGRGAITVVFFACSRPFGLCSSFGFCVRQWVLGFCTDCAAVIAQVAQSGLPLSCTVWKAI